MISIEKQSDAIIVSNITQSDMNLENMLGFCREIESEYSTPITKIIFDASNVKPTDYNTLTFFKAVAESPKLHKCSYIFKNAEDELVDSLEKLGFKNGKYNKKEYRTTEASSIFETTGDAVIGIYSDLHKIIHYTGELVRAVFYFIFHPGKLSRRDVLYYADKTGADAVPIVLMICFLMGAILAFQGVSLLSMFGLSIFVSNLVGYSIVRELGPLMVAIICTGRAGSAFAAELGTMKVNEEIDAMTTMGLKPVYILVIPKLLALVLVMPMLTVLGDFIGIIGGGLVTALTSQISFYEYIHAITSSMRPANMFESLSKSIIFAFLVAAIGCFRGLDAGKDAKGVGNATTSSVVSGIFLIVLADAVFTFLFPQFMKLIGIDYP